MHRTACNRPDCPLKVDDKLLAKKTKTAINGDVVGKATILNEKLNKFKAQFIVITAIIEETYMIGIRKFAFDVNLRI